MHNGPLGVQALACFFSFLMCYPGHVAARGDALPQMAGSAACVFRAAMNSVVNSQDGYSTFASVVTAKFTLIKYGKSKA